MYTGADWDAWMVSVDVADPPDVIETVEGLSVTLVEFAILAVTEAESVTVPLKPSRLVTVTIAVDDPPCCTLSLLGFIDRPKSGVVLLENLQAEIGWISQPLKLCHELLRCPSSQKTKPWTSSNWVVMGGFCGATPADFQAWSISMCIWQR